MIHDKYTHIKLGKDLRKFIIKLLNENKDHPKLVDFLSSLWYISEQYKTTEKINFALIAQIIDKAFKTTYKAKEWKFRKNKLNNNNEIELTDYEIFEHNLRQQLLELNKSNFFFKKLLAKWENLSVESYLERGTCVYEYDDELYEFDWNEFSYILNEGKYNE